MHLYAEDLPSQLTVHAELDMWYEKWDTFWKEEFTKLKDQHFKITGEDMRLSNSELKKLKQITLPHTIHSALNEVSTGLFSNC